MRRSVFEPNDADRHNSFALFGGAVSDSCDTLAFFIPHQNNFPKKDRPPVCLGLNRCGYSVCHADLLRIGLHNLRHDHRGGIRENEPSFTEGLVAAVSYVGLSGWLWLRWRNPIAPSERIFGPAIIATLIILIIVSVIWADQIF